MEKVSSAGRVLWAKRLHWDLTPWFGGDTHISARGDVVAVATERRPGAFDEDRRPSSWLGRFTTGGDLRWSRVWGRAPWRAAEPTDVAVDVAGTIWVVGTERDADDGGLDLFLRAYGATGRLGVARGLDGPSSTLIGGGLFIARRALAVTGEVQTQFREWGRVFHLRSA